MRIKWEIQTGKKIQATLVQTHVQYNFVTSSEQMGLIKKYSSLIVFMRC
jgi:hypothetical protein